MAQPHRFAYASLEELRADFARLGLDLPADEDVSVLFEPVRWGRLTLANRLVAHPMEGCDAEIDGAPGELTFRRYERFAAGGAGMIWFEACAVCGTGRANPRQLWLSEYTGDVFQDLVARTLAAARRAGVTKRPTLVLQLTHSGRYSRPEDIPRPIIAHHSGVLDGRHELPPDYPMIRDEELDALQEDFVSAAQLAAAAGFDAVDVKASHGYLLAELLAGHTRPGRYGGSYENRTRMLRETIAKVRAAVGDVLEVTCRLNAYDAIPWPYGWGAAEGRGLEPDLAEPLRLVAELQALGVAGLSITLGIPYYNPHVNRPADRMIVGWPAPPEHPAQGFARLLDLTGRVQRTCPDLPVAGAGYSWLRQFMPYVAAGAVRRGLATQVGMGRGAFAYPDFARDLERQGRLDPRKVCIACSGCTQMMRDGQPAGCVVRDTAVYGPYYRAGRARAHGGA